MQERKPTEADAMKAIKQLQEYQDIARNEEKKHVTMLAMIAKWLSGKPEKD